MHLCYACRNLNSTKITARWWVTGDGKSIHAFGGKLRIIVCKEIARLWTLHEYAMNGQKAAILKEVGKWAGDEGVVSTEWFYLKFFTFWMQVAFPFLINCWDYLNSIPVIVIYEKMNISSSHLVHSHSQHIATMRIREKQKHAFSYHTETIPDHVGTINTPRSGRLSNRTRAKTQHDVIPLL